MPNAADEAAQSLSTHTINILRVAAGQRVAVLQALNELEGQLIAAISAGGQSINKVTRLQALLAQTTASIEATYELIGGKSNADLTKLATLEWKAAQNALNKGIGAAVVSVAIPEGFAAAVVKGNNIFGNSSAAWWKSQSVDLQNKFRTAMNQAIFLGESTEEAARRIRGSAAAGFADGLMPLKKREAEALVRSSMVSVANQARLDSYAEMDDVVKGIAWLATLDGRTTPICKGLSRKEWRLPDYEPVGHDKKFPGPTAHWNCRSTQVPVMFTWAELAGKKLPSVDNATLEERIKEKLAKQGMEEDQVKAAVANAQASMDGQVHEDLSFDDWLDTKDDTFVDKTLGPGRAALWKADKATLAQMTDQNNRPLTLDQLEEVINGGGFPPETQGVTFLPITTKYTFTAEMEAKINRQAAVAIAQGTPELQKAVADIGAAQPDLAVKDQLAAAEAALQEAANNKKKAQALGQLKAKMVKADSFDTGLEAITPAQKQWFDKLNVEEHQAFKAAVEDAVAVKAQKAADTAATAALDAFKAKGPDYLAAFEDAQVKGLSPVKALLAVQEQLDTTAILALKAWAAGEEGIIKANIAKALLKTKGELSYDDYVAAQATAAEKAAAAKISAALTNAKKNLAKGGTPTTAQAEAIATLNEADKALFYESVSVLKIAQAKTPAIAGPAIVDSINTPAEGLGHAVAATKLAADAEAKAVAISLTERPAGFPDDASKLKVVRKLGGSTGAELVEDSNGRQFVRKSGSTPEHVREEMMADRLYAAFGLPVPEGALYEQPGGKVTKLTAFIPGKPFAELVGTERAAAIKQLKDGFAVDALLGNWDVLGMAGDNALWHDGKLYRIDNGGSLRFRAMGTPKKPAEWNDIPGDLWTMRDASMNHTPLGPIMKDTTVYDLRQSFDRLTTGEWRNVPLPAELLATLEERVRNLRTIAARAADFEDNAFRVGYAEDHLKLTMELRRNQIDRSLMGDTTRAGTIVKDASGKAFGYLRAGNKFSIAAPPPSAVPGDVWGVKIQDAAKSLNHKAVSLATDFNEVKMQGAFLLKASLQSAASGTGPLADAAKHYLPQLDALEASYKASKASGKPPQPVAHATTYKPAAAATAVPVKAVTAAPAVSVVDELHKLLRDQGVPQGAIDLHSTWNVKQGHDSWKPDVLIGKYWMAQVARETSPDAHYWKGNPGNPSSFAKAKAAWDAAAAKYGEANVKKAFAGHHALVQEQLEKVRTDYIDPATRTMLAIRTESITTMKSNGAKLSADGKTVDKGTVVNLTLGGTESHSWLKATYVYGDIATAKIVPFSRIMYLHWFEPSAGAGQSGFLGDYENEAAIDATGLPALVIGNGKSGMVGNNPFTGNTLAEWVKQGLPWK